MSESAKTPVIIIGGGGHARVILDACLVVGQAVLGFVDRDPTKNQLLGYDRLGDESSILGYSNQEVVLVNGLGSVGEPGKREEWYNMYKAKGYTFVSVIHPGAIVSKYAEIKEGVQVMAGCVVQAGVVIKENTIINTKASIDHDCQIGAHVHIAPGVTLSGTVHVGDRTHVGTGACVIQGISIGPGCIVGAGSVVVKSVGPQETIKGVPARSGL